MVRRVLMACVAAAAIACVWAVPAGAVSIVASPNTVLIGRTVTVSGDVLLANGTSGCGLPGTVILISGAFPGNDYGPGQGAVHVPVGASGHFSQAIVVNPSAGAGTYTINGRCGGGNLGVVASVTVTGLPRTGGSVGPLSDTEAIVLGSALVLIGGAEVGLTRRRRESTAMTRQ